MRNELVQAFLRKTLLAAGCGLLALGTAYAHPYIDECADCHGKDGASTETDVPVIAGQSEAYLKDTLQAYRDGKRPCPETKFRAGDKKRPATTMCKIAKPLTDDQVGEAAKYFAEKPFVRAKQKADGSKVALGKKVHDEKCEKCHSEGGSSKDDDAGILAGQWMGYLDAQLKDYKSGKREPPKKMKPKVDELSADQVNALVQYYGSQQ